MDAGSAIVTGLLLGLSSGGHCFWSCASVLGPYLVATEERATGARWSTVPAALRTLGWYNLGRLLAYLVAGLLVAGLAAAGTALPAPMQAAGRLATAAILAAAVLRPATPQRCWGARQRSAAAFLVGALQGLSPCPPFLVAIGLGLTAASRAAGLLLFVALFIGTALYTLPLAFLEPLRRRTWATWIVRGVGGAVCLYLVISALVLLR
jgi:sulfite exporter TauE/SafE